LTHHGYFHPSCNVLVGKGETINSDGDIVQVDGSVRTVPSCLYPHYDDDGNDVTNASVPGQRSKADSSPHPNVNHTANGWEAEFDTIPSGDVTYFSATFGVLSGPASNGADIALFPGLQQAGTSDEIIQPVLDYGDGAYHWQVRVENCCFGGHNYYDSYTSVNVGDTITGYMYPVSDPMNLCLGDVGRFYVAINDNGGLVNDYYVCNWLHMNQIFGGVLEVHYLNACNQLPQTGTGEAFYNEVAYINGNPFTFPSTWAHNTGTFSPNCAPGSSGSGTGGGIWWRDF